MVFQIRPYIINHNYLINVWQTKIGNFHSMIDSGLYSNCIPSTHSDISEHSTYMYKIN